MHSLHLPIADILSRANVISSHTLYKVKVKDDHQIRLKVRIASHGNEDSIRATFAATEESARSQVCESY